MDFKFFISWIFTSCIFFLIGKASVEQSVTKAYRDGIEVGREIERSIRSERK